MWSAYLKSSICTRNRTMSKCPFSTCSSVNQFLGCSSPMHSTGLFCRHKRESVRQTGRGRQADSVEQGQTVTQYIYSRTVLKYIISDFFFCYFMFLLHYISDGNLLRCMFMIATVTFQIKLLI